MDTKQEAVQYHQTSVTPVRERPFPPHIPQEFDELALPYEAYSLLLAAGAPSYNRATFTRDNLITYHFLALPEGLEQSLEFAAAKQGTKKDPKTGEQPGAIFHEYNIETHGGVELPGREGLTTLYNASDTNAHFILAHEEYAQLTGDWSLFERQRGNVQRATDYILRHLDGRNIFVVDPKHSDADRFALRVTYWKDSHLKGRENGEPVYPVVYPLSHIQNMAAIRAAARLFGSKELEEQGETMREALPYLYDKEIEGLSLAIDADGRVSGINSDTLHALHYLDPGDIDPRTLERFLTNTSSLETTVGYRTLSVEAARDVQDPYHAETVWTHEQAIIHEGAQKHSEWAKQSGEEGLRRALVRAELTSQQVYTNYLKDHPDIQPELFFVRPDGRFKPGGNPTQAWAAAARYYFMKKEADGKLAIAS